MNRHPDPNPVTLLRMLTWAALFNIGFIIARAVWLIWTP